MNFETGLVITLLYGISGLATYRLLRDRQFSVSASIAVSVPICQSAHSLLFQICLLAEASAFCLPAAGVLSAFLTFKALRHSTWWLPEARTFFNFARKNKVFSACLTIVISYSLLQIFFLPFNNDDALVYHFPRVFLFLQENTFYLESFTRYHQTAFPVGADLLFIPYVQLGTISGVGFFSLASYLSIGAASYSISRRFAGKSGAALSALAILSLTNLVLQSVNVKNDIIMTAALAAALCIILGHKVGKRWSWGVFFLFLWLCAFALSAKTTALAFLPGLGIVAMIRWRLYQKRRIGQLMGRIRKNWQQTVPLTLGLLILAQCWLFSSNILSYGSWAGPDEFTAMHRNHDSALGGIANFARYSIQIAEAGFLADVTSTYLSPEGSWAARIQNSYDAYLKPIFRNHGLSRWDFSIIWATQQDYSWFGLWGAIIFFICIPFALFKEKSVWLYLLPSFGYFALVCLQVSWMPWNGRFFIPFFVGAAPAVAVALSHIKRKSRRVTLLLFLSSSILTIKVIDFSRPLFPLGAEFYSGNSQTLNELFSRTAQERRSIWQRSPQNLANWHKGDPHHLLTDIIDPGTRVALYTSEHQPHYGYYYARPDIEWIPVNCIYGYGRLKPNEAIINLLETDIEYLLIVGASLPTDKDYIIRSSNDGHAHLLEMDLELMERVMKPETLSALRTSPAYTNLFISDWRQMQNAAQ